MKKGAKQRKIPVIVEVTNTGYSAYTQDCPVYTTGDSINEVYANISEAMSLLHEDDQVEYSPQNFKLKFDFQQFFTHYRVLNAKFLAERIGLNPSLLSQYVSGTKEPSPKQLLRIMNGINELGEELAALTFSTK
jgi:predicted RNase H-like HicB family nuclease